MNAPALVLLALAVTAPPVDPRVADGERLYRELEFEQAVVVLQDAIIDGALSSTQRARALVYLGLAQAQIGKSEPAERSFTAAFRADPRVELPAGIPPKIEAIIATARARADDDNGAKPARDLTVPYAVAGAGGVVVAGGLVVSAFALADWLAALDEDATQREAQELGARANTLMAVAVVVGAVGAATLGGGVALAVMSE